MKTVFFDLDGVLADFHSRFRQEFPDAKLETGWAIYKDEWVKRSGFARLSTLSSGIEVLESLAALKTKLDFRIELISSTGGADYSNVTSQKTLWIVENGLYFHFDKLNFVERGKDKAKFAKEDRILIDDTSSVGVNFQNRGGTFVHFLGDSASTLSTVLFHLEKFDASLHSTL